jgi:hypothetical protein
MFWLEEFADFLETGEMILVRMGDNSDVEFSDFRAKVLKGRGLLRGSSTINHHIDSIGELDQSHVALVDRKKSECRHFLPLFACLPFLVSNDTI